MKPKPFPILCCSPPGSFLRRLRSLYKLFPIVVFALLLGCEGGPIPESPDSNLVQAHWDAQTETLHIEGESNGMDDNVEIHDAGTGAKLGAAIVNADGTWKASATTPACEVHVELSSGTATAIVSDAPADCTGNPLSARVASENDIPTGVLVVSNPEPNATIPNAVILSPPQDLTVNVGEPVSFSGMAVGGAITPPISYYWNFGGAAANSTVQNPGVIVFSQPGTYFVTLSVSDSLGIPDPSPAMRTITVRDTNNPFNTTPVPRINQPTAGFNGQVNINVGESLFFSGSATDSTGSFAFTYEWDFSGAAPNQFGPQPGNVVFTRAGIFVVTLYATNSLGVRSTIPATVTINVGTSSGFNQTPVGTIARPRNDVTVNVGEALTFRARGRDPDNNTPLTYSWEFDGLAPNVYRSSSRDGGTITFNNPGIYRIRMVVTDSLGAEDPNPPIRTVTVLGSPIGGGGGNTPLNTQIISPPVDVQIAPGQSVFFSGQSVFGGTGQYQYYWNFDGGAPNSSLQTPGDITFVLPGQYLVQFYVLDLNGNVVGTPATRTITVSDPSNTNVSIISPAAGSTLQVGTPVNLVGRVGNNNAFQQLTYKWRIKRVGGTVVFRSNSLSPGSFTFTQPGEYRVRFTVRATDAFGNQTVASSAISRVTVTDPLFAANNAIAYPLQDMFIPIGQSITFQPTTDVFGTNLRYQWNFGGARTPSNQANPPPVIFSLPGTYVVTLRITGTDFNGFPVNLYGERLITVTSAALPTPGFPSPIPGFPNPIPGFPSPIFPPNPGFPTPIQPPISGAASPEGYITAPSSNINVRVGTPVQFTGTGFDPTGLGPLIFQWGFDGAAPNIQSQNPGTVTFNRVGKYVVTLLVYNSLGQFDQTPATVVVTVTP